MDWQTADAGGTHVDARDADFAVERSSAGGTESPLRSPSATVFGAIQGSIARPYRRGPHRCLLPVVTPCFQPTSSGASAAQKNAPSARVLAARASKLPTTHWQDAGDKVRQPPARSRPCGWWMRLRQPRAIAQALVGLDHLVTLIVTIHPRRPVLADNVRPAVQLIHGVGIHGHSATTMVLHRRKISPRIIDMGSVEEAVFSCLGIPPLQQVAVGLAWPKSSLGKFRCREFIPFIPQRRSRM